MGSLGQDSARFSELDHRSVRKFPWSHTSPRTPDSRISPKVIFWGLCKSVTQLSPHSHFGKFGSRSPDWQVFWMGDSIMGLTLAGRSYEQPATATAMAMAMYR